MEEFVQPADIPDSLKNEVVRRLAEHSVGFLRLEDTSHGRDAFLLGSGTLVAIGNTFAILTAHHVIQTLPRSGRLGVFLSPTFEPHSIDTGGLVYLKIARGDEDSVGPDLGAVILAPSIAGAIAAKKTFYDLEQRRDKLLYNAPDLGDGIWFVHGFADENTVVQPDDVIGYGLVKSFYSFGGMGRPVSAFQIGDHDYFTVPISPTAPPPVPKCFGGMSGGGLWQVPLERAKTGELVHRAPLLSGLAFYQEAVTNAGSAVKCHGRASLYGVAYDAIVRPNQACT
jgi:predicted RecA/RadA family phage recombinase